MIKKCLFPAAGYGTRFLPATKAIPKEMLPILNKPLIQYGVEEADKISARPGYSEHQTGLTHDLINTAGELITSEPEAAWIRENCADYGFIVRYQEGKEAFTGYFAEPCHIRYIGEEATDIKNSGLCLEEYLHIE